MNSISILLFENDIKEAKSIQIENLNADTDEKIFEMLVEIFYDGIKKLYGKDGKVNLEEIKDEEMYNLRKYFWSINFDFFYKVTDLNNNIIKNYEKKKGTDLYNLFFRIKTPYLIYILSFDFYIEEYAK